MRRAAAGHGSDTRCKKYQVAVCHKVNESTQKGFRSWNQQAFPDGLFCQKAGGIELQEKENCQDCNLDNSGSRPLPRLQKGRLADQGSAEGERAKRA